MNIKEKQKFLSSHWIRIKKLQNSVNPYKWELISLLSREYEQVKRNL